MTVLEKSTNSHKRNFWCRDLIAIPVILAILISTVLPALATPPEMPRWDEPVTAYVVYPAGRSPDADGHFEIEIFCEANFDIEWLSLKVGYTEEITFDGKLPQFTGALKEGESKVWRVKGTVTGTATIDDFEMPASVTLIVKYRFPYDAVLKDIEKRSLHPYDKRYLLKGLERVKGKTMTVMKPMPVVIPEPEDTTGSK